jgi:hypothetical protein
VNNKVCDTLINVSLISFQEDGGTDIYVFQKVEGGIEYNEIWEVDNPQKMAQLLVKELLSTKNSLSNEK